MAERLSEDQDYLHALTAAAVTSLSFDAEEPSTTQIERSRIGETLERVMGEPLGSLFFYLHLISMECPELLLFWHEIENFDSLPPCAYRNSLARKIYRKYLSPKSSSMLHIPAIVRDAVRAALDGESPQAHTLPPTHPPTKFLSRLA
jgi:hypothetical protein